VIGLREGVEAALIVAIVAAFLRREGQRDALRAMWAGVVLAVVLCTGIAVTLQMVDEALPQRQQEALETVVAAAAVAMVTFMIFWMTRHAADLAGDLRAGAAGALARGSTLALVGMAFFAVAREGFETAIFLLAAFQSSSNPLSTGVGAALGIAVAVGLGYAIYRGGVRINLSRFFRVTGFVLVLVAAGLLSAAVHSLSEAGVVSVGQQTATDLSWLVAPGSVRAALLTGMLGLQAVPTVAEVVAWLAYAIPMSVYVLWPQRPREMQPATVAAPTAG
jgi:high-affinity iron transporter